MYKLLVVDDESLEREALKRILEKRYQNDCSVSLAANGQEAITQAQSLRPDILVIDIEMPGINGLEAARIIKQEMPRCHVIILTAYQQFQYAQKAIAIGADDYLLKPVADDELYVKIDKTIEEVNRDRTDLKRRETLDMLAKDQFVLTAISGYAGEKTLKSQLDDLGITFNYGVMMTIRSDKTKSAEQIAENVSGMMHKLFADSCLLFEYDDVLVCALLMQTPYTDRGWITNAAEKIARQCGEGLRIGIGQIAPEVAQLKESYETAMEALGNTTAAQEVALYNADDANRSDDLSGMVYNLLLDRDVELAVRLTTVAYEAFLFNLQNRQEARQQLRRLFDILAARIAADTRFSDSDGQVDYGLAQTALSTAEVALAARSMFSKWVKAADNQPDMHLSAMRNQIDQYLQKNFHKDISIKHIAKDMHYSEPYFSKLFSRCFQRSFVAYLTDMRLKMAKSMLKTSPLSIKEIGAKVGYEDSNYFAKVFRKAYGISPSDYRRKSALYTEQEAQP